MVTSPDVSHLERWLLQQGVGPADAAPVVAAADIRQLGAGDVLFEEGDPCRGLWLVQKGRVRLYHATHDGRTLVTFFRGPGSPVELSSALEGRPFTVTAAATTASELVFVPRAALMRLAQCAAAGSAFFSLLGQEIRQRDIVMTIRATRDAPGRVYCSLLHLAQCFGMPRGEGMTIDCRLTRQDIADLTGIRIETASRILSTLEDRGIVRTRKQMLFVTDPEQLRKLNGCIDCQCDCTAFDP